MRWYSCLEGCISRLSLQEAQAADSFQFLNVENLELVVNKEKNN